MRRCNVQVFLAVLMLAATSWAVDGSMLKPPAGARVALVVFEDLECPSCAQAAPLLAKASEIYKVPLVVHDTLNPRAHPWTMDATVAARYIEQKYGRAVSDQFREYIFQCQPQITKANLRSYTDKFCAEHKIALPFMLDPQGQIAAGIRADQDLAQRVQVAVTPTILVVTANNWAEVTDHSQLYSIIERMQRQAPPAPAPKAAPAKRGSAKKG